MTVFNQENAIEFNQATKAITFAMTTPQIEFSLSSYNANFDISAIEFNQTEQHIAFAQVTHHIDFALSNAHTVITGVVLPDGTSTGDILRWNDSTGEWEVKAEPVAFKGILLTPAIAALIDAEGLMYYNSDQKAVLVCTEGT